MRYLIMALLFVASTAQAEINPVEVFGRMRVFQGYDQIGSNGGMGVLSNNQSQIGIRGGEDLGGGLRANFIVDTTIGADSTTSTGIGDRTSLVGFTNGWASIQVGRDKHFTQRLVEKFDALEEFYGSSAGVVHALNGTRISNATFVTVRPWENLAVNYSYSFSEVAGTPNAQVGRVDWDLGNFSTSVGRWDNGVDRTDILGMRYSPLSGTTLFGIVSDNRYNGVDWTGYNTGLVQALGGKFTGRAAYGQKTGINTYNLGLDYNLSRRTAIQLRVRYDDADLIANKRQQYAVGLIHQF